MKLLLEWGADPEPKNETGAVPAEVGVFWAQTILKRFFFLFSSIERALSVLIDAPCGRRAVVVGVVAGRPGWVKRRSRHEKGPRVSQKQDRKCFLSRNAYRGPDPGGGPVGGRLGEG